jgi:peptide-methionine (S)-S-oxide reductase
MTLAFGVGMTSYVGPALSAVSLLGLLSSPASGGERPRRERATFAGGCFWSMEEPFDKTKGVASTTTGFAGGRTQHPTYQQVAAGRTGHAEVVQVVFDPAKVSYERLLEVFWRNIDPLDAGGQFCDRGSPYRTAIFYESEAQHEAALASRERIEKASGLSGSIVTEVLPLRAFYPAGEEHQDYYIRNVRAYWSYRTGCGRDRRLRQIWSPGAED